MNEIRLQKTTGFFPVKEWNALTGIASKLSLQHWLNIGLKLVVFIILMVVLVPFSPKMPSPGLDTSWALGLNEAVAQGLAFGKDILFTLGPYSSIYTKAYHPSTDLMMTGGSFFLACSYWLSILVLMPGVKWQWTLLLAGSLCGMMYARDSLLFAYPLLTGLICYKILYVPAFERTFNNANCLILALLFAPFGLLPLIKGSLLILCTAVILICTIFFIVHKHYVLAATCLTSSTLSMLLFWTLAGQSLVYLPDYLTSTVVLASDFTEAMSLDGNGDEITIYLLACGLILLSIFRQKKTSYSPILFLFSILFVFLFLSFKTGFTRHYGHALISGTSILMAALLLTYVLKTRLKIPLVLLCIYASSYIDGHYTQISLSYNIISTYTAAWHGLKNRIENKNWLKQNYALTMDYLKERLPFPALKGTTDIYSYHQTELIAAQMRWNPRPVFQSYSVFSSTMAQKNKTHLLAHNRPENIIFKVEPIDGRLPSLEDGISWSVLLETYKPYELINDFLLLHAKKTSHPLKPMTLLFKEHHLLNERIPVPASGKPVFAEIRIKPTLYGRFMLMMFKVNPVFINVEYANGRKKQFRMIASMAISGFLLSPLIENTKEFALLYSPSHLLDGKVVRSMSITSPSHRFSHWQQEYTIAFKSLNERNSIMVS